ncbi:MAG: peptide-methionine (R)-S-oxide reductase MsrB [Candidatus Micrarchaeia archaeon]
MCAEKNEDKSTGKAVKSEEQWASCLTPKQYEILRRKGTELPFTGKYYNEHRVGKYYCAACHALLFSSDSKFDSHTGWPSFFKPVSAGAIKEAHDRSLGMERIEVSCGKCGGHLGHVFPDGPKPTGLRYCINSESLDFKESVEKADTKKGK